MPTDPPPEPIDDMAAILNGMSIEDAAEALREGMLAIWDTPPRTIGEKLARFLYVKRMNEEFERRGIPLVITTTSGAGG